MTKKKNLFACSIHREKYIPPSGNFNYYPLATDPNKITCVVPDCLEPEKTVTPTRRKMLDQKHVLYLKANHEKTILIGSVACQDCFKKINKEITKVEKEEKDDNKLKIKESKNLKKINKDIYLKVPIERKVGPNGERTRNQKKRTMEWKHSAMSIGVKGELSLEQKIDQSNFETKALEKELKKQNHGVLHSDADVNEIRDHFLSVGIISRRKIRAHIQFIKGMNPSKQIPSGHKVHQSMRRTKNEYNCSSIEINKVKSTNLELNSILKAYQNEISHQITNGIYVIEPHDRNREVTFLYFDCNIPF